MTGTIWHNKGIEIMSITVKSGEFERRLLSSERKKTEYPEKFLPKLLKRNDIAVDLGCGPGYYSKTIVHHVSKLYCIDKNAEFLDTARKIVGSKKAIFLNEDSTRTSVRPRFVDVIILANAFHDMKRAATAKEIKRIIKNEGRIIVVDWKKTHSTFGPPLGLRMNEEDYLSFFKGFSISRRFKVGAIHFGIVLVRDAPN